MLTIAPYRVLPAQPDSAVRSVPAVRLALRSLQAAPCHHAPCGKLFISVTLGGSSQLNSRWSRKTTRRVQMAQLQSSSRGTTSCTSSGESFPTADWKHIGLVTTSSRCPASGTPPGCMHSLGQHLLPASLLVKHWSLLATTTLTPTHHHCSSGTMVEAAAQPTCLSRLLAAGGPHHGLFRRPPVMARST
jgi:hypothetical protein